MNFGDNVVPISSSKKKKKKWHDEKQLHLSFIDAACEEELDRFEADITGIVSSMPYRSEAWRYSPYGINGLAERLRKIANNVPQIIREADHRYTFLLWQREYTQKKEEG